MSITIEQAMTLQEMFEENDLDFMALHCTLKSKDGGNTIILEMWDLNEQDVEQDVEALGPFETEAKG